MIKQTLASLLLVSAGMSGFAQAESQPLRGLLQDVRQFSATDQAVNKQREATFKRDLANQQALLQKSKARLKAAEAEQLRLKAAFDDNDMKLAELEALIQQRSGQLGEVFGVAKEEASELRSLLDDSLASAEYPGRTEELSFADSKRVPTLQELQALWYQMQLEMVSSGQISQFETPVVTVQGQSQDTTVTRFGLFGALTAEGEYLNWDTQQQALTVLPTQPDTAKAQIGAYLSGADNEIKIDPTRGQLFLLLDREPKLLERVHQGGEVGYLILGLGALGLLVAFYQMLMMLLAELKVRAQLRSAAQLKPGNALGRVLLAQIGRASCRERVYAPV